MASEIDNPTCCVSVGRGRVDPVRGPDPVSLELVDCITAALASDYKEIRET